MRFFKKNFILIFLFIASVSTGVLALSTALRLREFRSAQPQETSALTPQCKITFTINNTAPREIAQKPGLTPTIIITATPPLTATWQPTKTPPTPTPIVKQQIVGAPQTTASPTQIPTVILQPTKYLAIGTSLTPTPATKTTVTPTKTATPTKAPAPQLPVSGTNIPTIGAFLLGFLFLLFGVFLRPSQIEVGSKEQRKKK